MDVLKHLLAKAQNLWIWFKYTMFLAGCAASITFIRVNFFDSTLQLNSVTTPILMMPNAVIDQEPPQPLAKVRK